MDTRTSWAVLSVEAVTLVAARDLWCSRKEYAMRKVSLWLLILALPLVLVACSGSNQMLANKDRTISDKDREIAELTKEIQGLKTGQALAAQQRIDLKKALAELEAERKIRVDGNRVIMQNSVLFASGSVTITDEGKSVLDRMWKALADYADRDILIEGHTDNVPIAQKYESKYKSNWELSCARSLAVLQYLGKKADVIPSRLGAVGYGEYRPIADNSTEQGRKQNRRVVFVVGSRS